MGKFHAMYLHKWPKVGNFVAMKRLIYLIAVAIVLVVTVVSCGHDEVESKPSVPIDTLTEVRSGAVDSTVHRMPTYIVPGPLKQIFNDTNDLQLQAAIANGIEPISSLRTSYGLKRPLVHIATCDAYLVDTLYYSLPYLVPKAAQLLHDIGQSFHDTIRARGGKDYRIKVTSLLRTSYSVGKLRQRNRNASDQSCHQYGTTFDISWTRFNCRDSSYVIYEEDLKNILAEIVYDMREKNRCYAIFERRQGCFHITVR